MDGGLLDMRDIRSSEDCRAIVEREQQGQGSTMERHWWMEVGGGLGSGGWKAEMGIAGSCGDRLRKKGGGTSILLMMKGG